jgi:hypothetical protein
MGGTKQGCGFGGTTSTHEILNYEDATKYQYE